MDEPRITLVPSAKLILASASPRRYELFRQLDIAFSVVVADVDEKQQERDEPETLVKRLAFQKAATVASRYPHAWVLGADTIVVLDTEILGKPADKDAALAMLNKLSGRTHSVYTGFAIVHKERGVEVLNMASSLVTFRVLSKEEIRWYADSAEPYDKAGAYALQGRGAMFISNVVGSYTNIIGLPLSEVLETLIRLGALTFR